MICLDSWNLIIEFAECDVTWSLWNTSKTFRTAIERINKDNLITIHEGINDYFCDVLHVGRSPRNIDMYAYESSDPYECYIGLPYLVCDHENSITVTTPNSSTKKYYCNTLVAIHKDHLDHLGEFIKAFYTKDSLDPENIYFDANSCSMILYHCTNMYFAIFDQVTVNNDTKRITWHLGNTDLVTGMKPENDIIKSYIPETIKGHFYFDREAKILLNYPSSDDMGYLEVNFQKVSVVYKKEESERSDPFVFIR